MKVQQNCDGRSKEECTHRSVLLSQICGQLSIGAVVQMRIITDVDEGKNSIYVSAFIDT